jgi:8-oxo-dGTP pyrophosphatase MutT (NUDIX family)
MRITHTEQTNIHLDTLDKTGFWGRKAAGCLFAAADTRRLLFAHRSYRVQEPNTWGTWGGAIDEGESPERGLRREIREETGFTGHMQTIPLITFKHSSGFCYYNFLAIVRHEFIPQLNRETQNFKWVNFGEWPEPLHPGAQFLLRKSGWEIRYILKRTFP